MDAHRTLISWYHGAEDTVHAFGSLEDAISAIDAIAKRLDATVSRKAAEDIHLTSYAPLLGRMELGRRDILISALPPNGWKLADAVNGLSSPPDAGTDWYFAFGTDVRESTPPVPVDSAEFFDVAVILQELVQNGLICMVDSGRAPGEVRIVGDPSHQALLFPDEPAPDETDPWDDVCRPTLAVGVDHDIGRYEPLLSPRSELNEEDATLALMPLLSLLEDKACRSTPSNEP
ncbi:hypothetical protein [Jannaschia aquimarina]|uniref:Uncharacterized protein n=1 Tax=Jannaschia aquimarina TaxID=935700 RepID=A0A0D1EI95_9RHOB|nr:hypothetical protein [Jannaschia aquimarina]KIT15575.1 hypothetical protein jaqu_26720 [Jannaschia aquimarina]SNT27161.1 hypothetical protein SAMN05421775_109126 [Jannaschia aquimarina]